MTNNNKKKIIDDMITLLCLVFYECIKYVCTCTYWHSLHVNVQYTIIIYSVYYYYYYYCNIVYYTKSTRTFWVFDT